MFIFGVCCGKYWGIDFGIICCFVVGVYIGDGYGINIIDVIIGIVIIM